MPAGAPFDVFAVKIPPDKKVEELFEKANRNRPIESSIPGEIASVKESSRKAQADAKAAKRTNQIFTTITFISVLSVVVSLMSFLQGSSQRIEGIAEKANKASDQVSDLKSAVEAPRGADLKKMVEGLSEEVRAVGASQVDAKAEAGRSSAAVAELAIRLDALAAAVRTLDARGTVPKRKVVPRKRHRRGT